MGLRFRRGGAQGPGQHRASSPLALAGPDRMGGVILAVLLPHALKLGDPTSQGPKGPRRAHP